VLRPTSQALAVNAKRFFRLIVASTLALVGEVAAGEIFEHTDSATGTRVFVLRQGSTVARFAPSRGANVFSIEVAGIEYLRTPANMYTFAGTEHGTPVLYPTPNRVKNATFRFAGKQYAMEPNFGPHRIHGLVFGQPWRVVSSGSTDTSAFVRSAIAFAPGSEPYRQFPFAHELFLEVTVTEGAVRWSYEVDNRAGREAVPFGFGLHPFFLYQGSRQNTFVTLPATHRMEAQDVLPSGRLVPAADLDYPLGEPIAIASRVFDDVFWGMRPAEPAVIDFRDRNRQVQFTASPEFTHAVLWTENVPVLSLENQTSSADAHNLHAAGFEEAAHLQVCGAGQSCDGWVEYRFTASGDYDWIWEDPNFLLSQERCASCHGIAFSGGRAPALLGGEWQHAHSEAEIARVIRQGIPGTDMPAFAGSLTAAQVEGLAGFMERVLKEMPGQELQTALEVSAAGPRQSFLETFVLETVVDGLDTPWSFAFLPDGRIIVNEKPGRVRLFSQGVLSEPVRGTPAVAYRQDAGLLALTLHPDYAENGWIYLTYSDPGADPDTSATKIVRGRIRDHAWVDQETIWSAPPALYTADNSHFGARLAFAGGDLYFSIGDRGQRAQAQDLGNPYGKIHRLRADGTVPADNPFVATEGALASVWSYGHRNVQGLAFAPDGALWSSEHGPRGGDELNRIEAGGNYGWPLVSHGREFTGEPVSQHASLPGIADPALVWQDSIAPSGIAFCRGERFPGWQGSLLVTSLAAKELRRVEIEGDAALAQEIVLKGVGRIRDVQVGPDGLPYLAIERGRGAGGILRLVPAAIPDIPLFELSTK
jgi:glucose/arabinose dehydrogenase/galactose mutarotase-like enzyme